MTRFGGSPLRLRGRMDRVRGRGLPVLERRRRGRIGIIIIINVEVESSERFLRTKTRFSSYSPAGYRPGGINQAGARRYILRDSE